MPSKHHKHTKHEHKGVSREQKLAAMLAAQQAAQPPAPPPGPPPGPPQAPPQPGPPTGPPPGGAMVGQAQSNPSEYRASGDDMVLIGDGGGPFQAYGPYGGYRNPAPYESERSQFAMEPQSDRPTERVRKMPRRQIIDSGGKPQE